MRDRQPPPDVAIVLEALAGHADGLDRVALFSAVRARMPQAQPAQVKAALEKGLAGGCLEETGVRIRVVSEDAAEATDDAESDLNGRLVCFDLEAVVRQTEREPYTLQRVFQIGAVRFGGDQAWIAQAPKFCAYLELSAEDEGLIYKPDVRARYERERAPRDAALQAFAEYVAGAEMLVAYNGAAHDFRLLHEEYQRSALEPPYAQPRSLHPKLVDALYLALALWPTPPNQHRLAEILERLNIQVEEFQWHEAVDDAKMVVELLTEGVAQRLAELPVSVTELLASAGEGSDSWALVSYLQALPAPRHFSVREVANVIDAAIAGSSRKRVRPEASDDGQPAASEAPSPLRIPAELQDESGQVSLEALVRAAQGERAEPRVSQQQMLERMRSWVRDSKPALVEAPTGTGKSYAILAVALDWLASSDTHQVVIATFTKQLQSQLATDIEQVAAAARCPDLEAVSDMVKGTQNRLSLRALVQAVSDLTEADPTRRTVGRFDFSADPRYRDLCIYLLSRFLCEGSLSEEWLARSVDRVDVPAFFQTYAQPRFELYLLALSQAESGEYDADRGGASRLTTTVAEALQRRRLIVANHALLLAHRDLFHDATDDVLLIVDEAHELENAATQALGSQIDTAALLRIGGDVVSWASDQPDDSSSLTQAARDLDAYLDDQGLQSAAMHAFSTQPPDPLGRSALRTVTIASPLQGDAGSDRMSILAVYLRRTSQHVGHLRSQLRSAPDPTDRFEADRLGQLRSRGADLDEQLRAIVADVDDILGPQQPPALLADGRATAADAADDAGTIIVGEGDEEEQLVLTVDGEIPDDDGEAPPDDAEQPDDDEQALARLPNRVVWMAEIEELDATRLSGYRFTVRTSPIELSQEPGWDEFKRLFRRVFYVSATLRVAGEWTFIRRRLDLAENAVAAVTLDSPFDHRAQARLVCFSDFPSWSEHDTQAMRTVAHQLTGYAREVIDQDRNGALVLTTSRVAAAGIFERLAARQAHAGATYPLISAGIWGNQRAVATFQSIGGIVVGTRGLWQGVDIRDGDRLALVWINKLPFASFTDPIVAARLELERRWAEAAGDDDPDAYANERYYLPLAALGLRQAVGRLIRSGRHRGVIVVSDRKLAGPTRLRATYRRVFLGSLDPGLLDPDPDTGEENGAGNVCSMQEGWRRIFSFYAQRGVISPERLAELTRDDALSEFCELPELRAIRAASLSADEVEQLRATGELPRMLVERCTEVARLLNPDAQIEQLRPKQVEVIEAVGEGSDVLGVLPTGYGKSYTFQLPALVMPGTTVVVSPLVSLMTDQALGLNQTIGGMVRALVAPMRESNSRTGKSEIHEQLTGRHDHGIKLVYLSPERLAQRQFQEWIRAGVRGNVVTRIAIDEAHTFIQWGDEFRPAIRRAENFLRALRADHPSLRLTALTATANKPVRMGLRESLFGLGEHERHGDGLRFVGENPLRPELALYRRSLTGRLGQRPSVAGLVERVVAEIDGHAIFYCLTVRQTEELYRHLSDHLAGQSVQVLRYHGRMTDAEKTAVANTFKHAPGRDEDGYRRMVVVATSAFGLGIDRPDIRCVFCVSPPTDLAALYQQLGRAGRDRAARADTFGPYTAGMAVIYQRASRTLTFMTQPRAQAELYARAAARILNDDAPISCCAIADDLVGEDYAARRMSEDEAADPDTLDGYQTAVVRVLAELDRMKLVTDQGDFPERVEVRPGDVPCPKEMLELRDAILDACAGERRVEVAALAARLSDRFDETRDAGGLWATLLDLHTLGYLDVSQRGNTGQLTALRVHDRTLPAALSGALSRRQRQVQLDVAELRDWFASTRCVNEDFRAYFEADVLPDGTCHTETCRCSACWSRTAHGTKPALLDAFQETDLRPASATSQGQRKAQRQLDEIVCGLLRREWRGLGENLIRAVLRGDDHYFSHRTKKREPLWAPLLMSRAHSAKPGLRPDDLRASLARLEAAGVIARQGARYRLARYIAQEAARQAAQTQAPAPQPATT